MQFACDQEGRKVLASRGLRGFCPACRGAVLPKCGQIKVHHWAHQAGEDCDSWFEPETEWHRHWKSLAPPDRVEVVMGEHRADLVTRRGVVVELQSAPLSPEQVKDREQFYGNMAWIVNAEPLLERLLLLKRFDSGRGFSFQWKHHPPSWRHATRPEFLDLGVGVSLDALLGCRRTVATMPDDYYARRVSRRAPDRADELEPALRQPGAFLLRIHSLHANGFGSVLLAARASLVKEIAGL